MAAPEVPPDATLLQQFASGIVIGVGTLVAMLWRFFSKRGEGRIEAQAAAGRAVAVGAGSIADGDMLVELAERSVKALEETREMIHDWIEEDARRRAEAKDEEIRERLDEAEKDRREILRQIEDLRRTEKR